MDIRVVSRLKKGTPKVFRRIPAPGKIGYKDSQVYPINWRRIVANREESYVIFPPDGTDIILCWICIKSTVKVTVTCHIVDNGNSFWLIEFPHTNALHQVSPATINLDIAANDDQDLDLEFDEG